MPALCGFLSAAGYAAEPHAKNERSALEEKTNEALPSYRAEHVKKREETALQVHDYCKENGIEPYILGFSVSGHIKLPNRGWGVSHTPLCVVGPGYCKIAPDELEGVLQEKDADLCLGEIEKDGKIKIEAKNDKYEIAIPPLGYGLGPCDDEPQWGSIIKLETLPYNKPRFAVRKKSDASYSIIYDLDTIIKGNIFALDMNKIDMDEESLLEPYKTPLNKENEK